MGRHLILYRVCLNRYWFIITHWPLSFQNLYIVIANQGYIARKKLHSQLLFFPFHMITIRPLRHIPGLYTCVKVHLIFFYQAHLQFSHWAFSCSWTMTNMLLDSWVKATFFSWRQFFPVLKKKLRLKVYFLDAINVYRFEITNKQFVWEHCFVFCPCFSNSCDWAW